MTAPVDSASSLEPSAATIHRWYAQRWFRTAITTAFSLLVAGKFVHSVFFKENDFANHLAWGGAVRAGDWQPIFSQYPPGRLLFDEFLSLLPHSFARALVFSAAIASLFATRAIWRTLATDLKPATPAVEFAASSCAFSLFALWIVRDLDDCGLQTLLLFMLSMAAWAVYRGAHIRAGAWLALAISYKVTPLLFVALLIWKRRFAEAGWTIVFIAIFNLAMPALVWGPQTAWDAARRHVALAQTIVSLADPTENGIEPPTYRNHSLKLAIARYLQTYPPGHPLFVDRNYDDDGCTARSVATADCHQHPLFVQFLDLKPAAAGRIATGLLLALAVALAIRTRRRWRLKRDPSNAAAYSALAPEWAVTCALAAILSPLAWAQHLVLMLPCGYLVFRDVLTRNDQPRLRWAPIALMAFFIWIVARDLLTKRIFLILASYHGDMLAILVMILATLTIQGAIQGKDGAKTATEAKAAGTGPAAAV